MITNDIKVANAIKTLSDTCKAHDKCFDCPMSNTDGDICFMDYLRYCGLEYVQVKQHGDNEYFISVG